MTLDLLNLDSTLAAVVKAGRAELKARDSAVKALIDAGATQESADNAKLVYKLAYIAHRLGFPASPKGLVQADLVRLDTKRSKEQQTVVDAANTALTRLLDSSAELRAMPFYAKQESKGKKGSRKPRTPKPPQVAKTSPAKVLIEELETQLEEAKEHLKAAHKMTPKVMSPGQMTEFLQNQLAFMQTTLAKNPGKALAKHRHAVEAFAEAVAKLAG